MHKEHNNNTTKTTTHDIMWFTLSLGVTSIKLCFIQLFTKTIVLTHTLSCRSFQVLKAVHTAPDFLNHPKPSAHTAAEVVHAHSWDLTFLQQALASHQFILHQNPKLTSLQECLFIHYTYYKTMGTPNPKPWT